MGVYQRKREQTKSDLLAAFWKQYEQQPIDKITVQDVANSAGYNRATFYVHFRDVYHALQEIEEGILADFDAVFSIHYDGIPDVAEILPRAISFFFAERQKYFKVLLSPRGDPFFVEKCKGRLRGVLVQFQPNGINLSLEQEYYMNFIGGGVLTNVARWLELADINLDEFIVTQTRLILALLPAPDLLGLEEKAALTGLPPER